MSDVRLPPDTDRDLASRWLVGIIQNLQREYAKRAPEQHRRFPGMAPPCHTCAINPSTNVWQGQDATALRLVTALYKAEPFVCHDGWPFDDEQGWQVDMRQADLCSGFTVLLSAPDLPEMLRRAVFDAMHEHIPDIGHLSEYDSGRMDDMLAMLIEAAAAYPP